MYKVVELGDEILRDRAMSVTKLGPHIDRLLDNMRDTMYANQGVGLAAPQIGVSKRAIVVDVGEGLVELLNPVLAESRGELVESEGCLSMPRLQGEVSRATWVKVTGSDRLGNPVELEAEDFLARALQHEIDHLNGVLFVDKAKNIQKV